MKFLNWWVNNFTIGGFFVASVITGILGLILIGSLIFGYQPYYKSKLTNPSFTFSFTDFVKGIPLNLEFSDEILDTNINVQTKRSGISGSDTRAIKKYLEKLTTNDYDQIVFADTIKLDYTISDWRDMKLVNFDSKIFDVTGNLKLKNGVVHIQPKTLKERSILVLPLIFLLLLMSYCFWQFALFLQYIQSGSSFDVSNYNRLRNVGLALLSYNFLLIIFSHYFSHFSILISFTSSKPDFRSPFHLSGTPDLDYEISYALAGFVFLILASAFKKGNQLQQENDLTI